MLSATEQFERFITVVRSENGVPDEVSLEEYVNTAMGEETVPDHYLRVEISWDGCYSLWSLRFNEAGMIVDDHALHQVSEPSDLAAEVIAASLGDNVVVVLEAALPRLAEHFGDQLMVMWEYHKPTMKGELGEFWDCDWASAEL